MRGAPFKQFNCHLAQQRYIAPGGQNLGRVHLSGAAQPQYPHKNTATKNGTLVLSRFSFGLFRGKRRLHPIDISV
ncbi:MAG: hypothetical protein ACJAQW_001963 [Paracoccaceae bacterium]|jgi:hypothetical protein